MGLLDHLSGIVDFGLRSFELGTAVHVASMFQWHSALGLRVQQASGRGSQRDARVHKHLPLASPPCFIGSSALLRGNILRGWHLKLTLAWLIFAK